jgi:hypothetical protein
MKALATALTIIIALTSGALAWGDEGHRIAAEIAKQYFKAGTGILFSAGIGDELAYPLQFARSIKSAKIDQWRVGSAAT